MFMVQAINDQDTANQKNLSEVLLNTLDNNDLNHVLITEKHFSSLWQYQFSKLSLLGNRKLTRYSPEIFKF